MASGDAMPHHTYTTPHHTPTTTPTATDDGVVGADEAILALRERGIVNPEELLALSSPEVVQSTCRWWDGQASAGPGVLAKTLLAGGVKNSKPKARSVVDQQREYGEQICDWLGENFPDLCDPKWGPHPASIAAVIRLHYSEGKGNLRKSAHGPIIRKAVKDFNKRYDIKESK